MIPASERERVVVEKRTLRSKFFCIHRIVAIGVNPANDQTLVERERAISVAVSVEKRTSREFTKSSRLDKWGRDT